MTWGLLKVEDQRKKLVEAYIDGEASMTHLAKKFNISRKTAYKWYNRYVEEGIDGLLDRSKAPHSPKKYFNEESIRIAVDLKLKFRKWGPKKILVLLKRRYPEHRWPSPTRLYQIFKEYHLVVPKRLRNRVPATHPLADVGASNDVWMVDFKGDIFTGDGNKCVPLTITDGYSRYLLCCEHLPKRGGEYVWPIYESLFKEMGIPNRIRTDNGPPFGSRGAGRLTPLAVKLVQAGVTPEWINPGHPEENGRHERMHLTLKQTTAQPPANTLTEQIQRMKQFQEEYNYERPHEALKMDTPSKYYTPLTRSWDGVLRSPEYDTKDFDVRKVGQSGCIWLNGIEYYISQTLTGEYVGFKEGDLGELAVFYGPVYLGKLAKGCFQKPKLKPKRIVRR